MSAIAASLVAFTLAFTLLSGDAFARHVRCGERVTKDVRLDSDLNDCPRAGLIAGASGITIDLDGHTIDGTGRSTGIVNGYGGAGRRNVTVKDGTVRGFKVGVRSGGRGMHLRRLTVTQNATGGVILRGSRCTVERSTVSDNGYGHGISVTSGSDCRLDSNRVFRHLGAGIATSRSSGHRIEDNRVSSNRRAGILLSTTTDSVVERNSLLENEVGISLFDRSDDNVVRRNSAAANVTGIALTFGGERNRIESNSVSGSESAGVRLAETRTGNLVLRNLVTLSGLEGIRVIDSAGAVIEANAAYDNAGDGIFVDAQDTGPATLRRNTANHNGDDGIDADSTLVVMDTNAAERNTDLGIEAVAGVTDAGGNGARWNGNAAECAGVACSY